MDEERTHKACEYPFTAGHARVYLSYERSALPVLLRRPPFSPSVLGPRCDLLRPLLIDTLHSRVLFLPRIGMRAVSVPLVHERMLHHGWLISCLEEKGREDTISLGSLRHVANLNAHFSA